MALAHEHILSCAACNSPLLLTGLAPAVQETHAVIYYHQSITDILAADSQCQSPVLSYLRASVEDDQKLSHAKEVPKLLHVLHMEGFDSPDTRREFAEHCGLAPEIFEGHFEAMSRLTGAGVGVCWCACHDGDTRQLSGGDVDSEEDDGFRPSTPSPVPPMKVLQEGGDKDTMSDDADSILRKRKRWSSNEVKRWPELKRPHRGADSEWTL